MSDFRIFRVVQAKLQQLLTDLRKLPDKNGAVSNSAAGNLFRQADAYDGLRYIDSDDGTTPTYLPLPSEGRVNTLLAPTVALALLATTTLADIPALLAYTGAATSVVVQDKLRGGTFVKATAGVAGAADSGQRFAYNSGTTSVWQRLAPAGIVHVDWFIDGSANCAPGIQAAMDATSTSATLHYARKTSSYNIAPWARPDGRACLLYRSKPITIQAYGSEYGGYLSYDYTTPSTTDIFSVASSVYADSGQGTYYGYRINGLSIIPGPGATLSTGRNVLQISVDSQNGLADLIVEGGQFVAANPNGRAINGSNTGGANGMFLSHFRNLRLRGGVKLAKLGDSCTITQCVSTGPNIGFDIDLLTPADVHGASALFSMTDCNVTNYGGALKLTGAATFYLGRLNFEMLNATTTGNAVGTNLVLLVDCGTLTNVGGTAFSGSWIEACKFNPTDGSTYASSSGANGLSMLRCRSVHTRGGSIGNGQQRDSSTNALTGNGYSVIYTDCDSCSSDGTDIQLTQNSVGIAVLGTSRNIGLGGFLTWNYVVGAFSAVKVLDQGAGTTGVVKTPTLQNSWTTVNASTEPLTYTKTPHGQVRLQGVLAPPSTTLTANQTIATMPAGFLPALNCLRSVYVQSTGGVWSTQPVQVVGIGNGALTGAVRIQTSVSNIGQVAFDFGYAAPPA